MKTLFYNKSSKYGSEELAWLAFNDRVLEEAADQSNPLMERVKFVSIVSSNLEEFFVVRFAGLLRKVHKETKDDFPITKLLQIIRNWVYEQKHRQSQVFDQLVLEFKSFGIQIETEVTEASSKLFTKNILHHIAPIRILEKDSLPKLSGGRLYVLVKHPQSYSLIEVPHKIPRLHFIHKKQGYFCERLIHNHLDLLFPNHTIEESFTFKISRDAEITVNEDAADFLKSVEAGLLQRDSGSVVRLETDSLVPGTAIQWLQKKLGVPDHAVYQLSLPLHLKSLMEIYEVPGYKKLRNCYPEPKRPRGLKKDLSPDLFFKTLQSHDLLLHHPYDSFDPVVELVQNAAKDPKVTRICQTLYRTTGKSPLLEALEYAAKKGKKVTALVEIKARFDEANNIRWARTLEKAGVNVIYGTTDLKIHAKLTYVERTLKEKKQGFVHIGTGNYHPRTARLYTDLGLITAHPLYVQDAVTLFDSLELMDKNDSYDLLNDPKNFSAHFKVLKVSPNNLYAEILKMIDREAKLALAGKPARIRAKMNGLVEKTVIDALYKASQAGVKIDLLVRGMCTLRPRVKGLSENIQVRSIVDKYLEHSRFFIFENGGTPQVWLSSADWMSRNFFKRIEVAVPILNPEIRDYMCETIWNTYDQDNVKSRLCTQDGVYQRILPGDNDPFRSQIEFEKIKTPHFNAINVDESSEGHLEFLQNTFLGKLLKKSNR